MNTVHNQQSGFTLVEIAVVLMIVTLLLTGLVPTISSQIEQRNTIETRKQLEDIQQALIGYAIINDRLPCPATTTSNGVESFLNPPTDSAANGNCTSFNGYLPVATLGIMSPTDNNHLAVDSWNNPIRYAVTSSNINAFTMTGGMRNNFSTLLNPTSLLVCISSTASGFTTSNCGANNGLTTAPPGVPVVIFSTGKNGSGSGADEIANTSVGTTNKTFISHTPTSGGANEFDDIVVWISPNILLNKMISAGKLP